MTKPSISHDAGSVYVAGLKFESVEPSVEPDGLSFDGFDAISGHGCSWTHTVPGAWRVSLMAGYIHSSNRGFSLLHILLANDSIAGVSLVTVFATPLA